jgi:hypothetical protein
VRADIRIRIRGIIIHIQMESTSIRTIIPITTSISQTRSIHIHIIALLLPVKPYRGSHLYSQQRRRISCLRPYNQDFVYSFLFSSVSFSILISTSDSSDSHSQLGQSVSSFFSSHVLIIIFIFILFIT